MSNPEPPVKEATDHDARFFFTIVKYMEKRPDTNWDAVAQELGYSNANTALTRFGQIKKKLGLTFDKSATPKTAKKITKSQTSKSAKTSGTKSKAKTMKNTATAATTPAEDDEDSQMPETPSRNGLSAQQWADLGMDDI